MTASLSQVSVKGVSRVFGRTYALHRVTTRFEAGTLTALLGPNGAGKSTLINILATLQRPDRGEVRFGKWSLEGMIRGARGLIGYVSHDALLYSDLTGTENLAFFARIYGVKDPDRPRALIARVGLEAAAGRPVMGYSRGMRQRLSIARALLQDPALLLLDEPFTGIDREGAAQLYALFAEERDAGKILVLSTHRLGLPPGLVTGVRLLDRGRLRLDRPLGPEESLSDVYAEALAQRRVKGGEGA